MWKWGVRIGTITAFVGLAAYGLSVNSFLGLMVIGLGILFVAAVWEA